MSGVATPDVGSRSRGVAISCRELSVRYGETRALEGVDLEIPAGRITAVVGPSGCGKSSFLLSINRLTDLLPDCRVTGTIRVGDRSVYGPGTDVRALRRRVGMVFQAPNPFPVTIRENLAIPLREHGVRDREALDRRIRSSLEAVGLREEVAGRMGDDAATLSGGQQQRLCLARALVLRPEVLLMDEPCSALDPLSSGTVEDTIVRLRGRYTVVIVTHNLAQARRIADRTALFWRREGAGRLVEVAPTERFFEAPRHRLTKAYVEGRRG